MEVNGAVSGQRVTPSSDSDGLPGRSESDGVGGARAVGRVVDAPEARSGAGRSNVTIRAGAAGSRRPPLWVVFAVVVAVVSVAFVAMAAQSAWVRHQLAVSFNRQPERYLELYFTRLPTSIAPRSGGKQLVFAVAMATHDLSVRGTTLTTTVSRPSGRSRSVSRSINLPANGVTIVDGESPLPPGVGPWELVVRLAGRSEYLHFAGTT